MKKYSILITILLILTMLFSVSGCSAKYAYIDCEEPLSYEAERAKYYYRSVKEPYHFTKKIEENGLTFYINNGLEWQETDKVVDAVKSVQEFCDVPKQIFMLKDSVTYVGQEGLWVNTSDSAELIGAVLIENASKEKLPFGFYAGISANMLKNNISFSIFSENKLKTELKKYPYVAELQYPLYTLRNTTKDERNTAWNFALNLGKTWLNNHTIENLNSITLSDIQETLTVCGAKLPNYKFVVGDNDYPIQIQSDNFNCYFAHNYKDCELNEDLFSLNYTSLTDFITNHENMVSEVAPIYGYKKFPKPVDCFFGLADEFNQTNLGFSTFTRNTISCYTVGIFGHEIMHWIAEYSTSNSFGVCDECICSFFGVKYSTSAKKLYFQEYMLEFENRYSTRKYTEQDKAISKSAKEIYDKKYGKCSIEDFRADLFLHTLAYLFNLTNTRIMTMAQGISFVNYIYDTYGFQTLDQINRDFTTVNIDGKTYNDFKAEWIAWLENNFQEFI